MKKNRQQQIKTQLVLVRVMLLSLVALAVILIGRAIIAFSYGDVIIGIITCGAGAACLYGVAVFYGAHRRLSRIRILLPKPRAKLYFGNKEVKHNDTRAKG